MSPLPHGLLIRDEFESMPTLVRKPLHLVLKAWA
jgi:hypothetical protein